MTAALAVCALRSAIARRRPKGTVVVHSDRAGQFRSRAVRAHAQGQRARRLHGSHCVGRRQRRDGILLRTAPEEQPQPATALASPQRLPTSSSSGWSTPTTAAVVRELSASSHPLSSSSPSPHRPASTTIRWHDQSQLPSTNRAADPAQVVQLSNKLALTFGSTAPCSIRAPAALTSPPYRPEPRSSCGRSAPVPQHP